MIKIEQNIKQQSDLKFYKNLTLFFALSTLAPYLPLKLFLPMLGSFIVNAISILGLTFFAYGTMKLTSKYSKFKSDKKIGWYLLLLIICQIISDIISYQYPISMSMAYQYPESQARINSLINHLNQFFLIKFTPLIITGLITLITAYYFTKWFNNVFSDSNPTNSFLYYGIFVELGPILISIGILLINISRGILGFLVLLLLALSGLIMFISGEIFLIVAGFKIYYRVNAQIIR